ncbi:carbon-nitrogen hydrolase family protein [Roseivivax sp. THAF30]|uniref:carbon-nitrogen hydrolase family protein n=1 Tax=Roseivivax sp. THAF30 TaxID=2587852 RepID=UPI001267E2AA|nr:carbon-nitrogen hydrolase family protein [Roseivivax sp. THAF30]QFT64876.1 2-oxoglutaramate amidase [Roseivivax sp. THAF30]
MKAALLQLTSSDDPAENLETVQELVSRAASSGADFVLTPEVTNCVSASRTRQNEVLRREADDITLPALCETAAHHGIWLLIGSLALKSEPPEERFVNRSFLIDPDGAIVARYDKMHMFDVQVSDEETYRESAGYAPGDRAVLAETPFGKIGLTICYDLRFAYLYRRLAQAGARLLTVPSAFSTATGPLHWEPLLRARAIETGSYVLAPAQVGTHSAWRGKTRKTYGHSMVVSPWGEVLIDADDTPGVHMVEIDPGTAEDARKKVPSLTHDRAFVGP